MVRKLESLRKGRTLRHTLVAGALLLVLTVAAVALPAVQAQGEVTIGWIPWDEDIAVSYLWKAILEEQGYTVNLVQLDVAPIFAGLTTGDIDLFLDSWLPVTHGTYWERFGDEIDKLGVWYDQAVLGLAVPNYVAIDSLAELKDHASEFNRTVVGIDAGAGVMRITREEIMPSYGVGNWQLLEGSTPAMLAELDRAISRGEWTVVTLWSPHWAFATYPIKYLADPDNVWPPAEEIAILARQGLAEEDADLARWMSNFKMDDMALGTLENEINARPSDPEAAVRAWLSDPDHRALVDSWLQ